MGSTKGYTTDVCSVSKHARNGRVAMLHHVGLALSFMLLSLLVQGCASGGYPGAVIASLTASTITLDAGQSMTIGASTNGNLPLSWTLSGTCPNSACGSLSSSTGTNITYTAPSPVATPFQVQLNATVAGTTNARTVTINVNPAPALSGTPPPGTVGVPYSYTFTTSGGTSPLKLSVQSGTPPPGLTFNATSGTLSGTPTAAGTSSFVLQLVDSSDVPVTVTASKTVTIAAAGTSTSLSVSGNPPSGSVGSPYSTALQATGGTAPYTWSVASGTLPAGLSLNASTGVIAGTPSTAGTSSVVIQARDAMGNAGTGTYAIVIAGGASASPISIGSGTLPNGTVGASYASTVGVTGGTSPYTCTLASGTLPAGLTLNSSCSVTGTPTAAGTSTVNVTVTDAGSPAQTKTAPQTITINQASQTLTISNPPAATANTPYTGTVPITGGTSPYTCTLAGGTLPTGLSLGSNCAITGTPTVAGSSTVTVKATDASSPALSNTGTVTVTVNPSTGSLVLGNPPAATVNTPYTGTVPVTGGTSPYTCTVAGGSLPTGLSLGSNCAITGTPTVAGSSTVTVKATDASTPSLSNTGTVTVTVNANTSSLVLNNPPIATVSTPYTGTIPVTGGSGNYTCSLASGTLPAGLTLGSNCTITGTPTAAGSSTVQVTATDSNAPSTSKTGPVTVSVQAIPAVTFTGSLPKGVVNQPYTQTLHAAGGVGPYTYAITAGALPAGISLSSTGVLSGTPTAPGASGFTVTATDSEATPQTASLPLTLLVTYAATTNDALLQGPYAFLFQGYDDVAAGVLAYKTATAGSITADGNGAITAGEEDSNHQGSNPTGNTIAMRTVLGTYSIGADRRGSLTLTAFDANGTVANTTTYAIALRAAVAPATNAAAGSLIEYDGDQAVGTKGSGTLLAQTSTAFTTGLAGNYAFGLSGDTPCLPTCTVGIVAGPVASVGRFAASGGTVSGISDTNIGSTNTASAALSGTYSAADSSGRVQLTLNNASLAGVPFPTDYAAYVVDANRVILLSTDKHSSYILQAGTAQVQRQATFSNASLGAAYVGYENSPVSPGLLNTTLQNVLNLSTATVFRGTGNGSGTCTTTNVDSSGTTGVVNSLGGVVSAPLVTAALGSYQTLGDSACTVAANGRAVLNYPAPSALIQLTLTGLGLPTTPAPRVVYLTDTNSGYFLETSYAGLGMLEAQTGAPFSNANLNGTYVYGSIPASTLATVNSSGEFTADGAGNTSSTVDRNVGVGTVNVLQLGVTATATYNITDTAAGRFLLSSGEVVYEIAPGRFALLEPEVLNTSAYVALLF